MDKITRVLAFDPGMIFGYGVADRRDLTHFSTDPGEIVALGTYEEKHYNEDMISRQSRIGIETKLLLDTYHPDVVLMEDINLSFDRKDKTTGRTLNRKKLQIYSLAWSTIFWNIIFWKSCVAIMGFGKNKTVEFHTVPLPKPNPYGKAGGRKEMIMRFVRLNYKVTPKSTHEAEALFWCMQYERRSQ